MGDIAVSGGGLTTVSTTAMLEQAAHLRLVSAELHNSLGEIRRNALWSCENGYTPLWVYGETQQRLAEAITRIDQARDLTESLEAALDQAAEAYGAAERAVSDAAESGGAELGWMIGAAGPLVLVLAACAAAGAAGALLASALVTGSPRETLRLLGVWVNNHPEIINSALFVELVRCAVSSVDDVMLGALHVPLPLARAVDDRALGWFGLRGSAKTVIALANPGALAETPATVTRAETRRAPAASSFQDLAARIPSGEGRPQIRIEKYSAPGQPARWVVYAGGTLDTALTAKNEPWDNTSNVQGVAGADPASVRATLAAMREAGIQQGDQVIAVGYSQGGIVATDVVTTGGYSNAALVTFGSPTGQVEVPRTVPNVAVEIREDLIPALGGEPRSTAQGGLDRTVVRRSIYDERPPPTGVLLPAHALSNYRETAALMDASPDERLQSVRASLTAFTGGRDAEVSLWRAERQPGSP